LKLSTRELSCRIVSLIEKRIDKNHERKEDDWKEKLANTSNGLSPFEEPVLVEKDLERAELFAASHHLLLVRGTTT